MTIHGIEKLGVLLNEGCRFVGWIELKQLTEIGEKARHGKLATTRGCDGCFVRGHDELMCVS